MWNPRNWFSPAVAVSVVPALLLGGCLSPRQELAGERDEAGRFTPLFNGRDLSGWVQVLDSPWVVEDGVLLSRQDPSGRLQGESWLLTERDYQDFILRLKFRITPGGNSGVFVRDPVSRQRRSLGPPGANPPWEAGYEMNINGDEPNYPTGSIWAIAGGPAGLQREGEWNDLRIKIQGTRIWTWVNGRPAVDGVELPPRAARGAIGLQRHGTPAYRDKLIEFRDVEIREL